MRSHTSPRGSPSASPSRGAHGGHHDRDYNHTHDPEDARAKFQVRAISNDSFENGKNLFQTLVKTPYLSPSTITVGPGEYQFSTPVVIDRPVHILGDAAADRRTIVLVGEFIVTKGGCWSQIKHLSLVGSPNVFFSPVLRIQWGARTGVRLTDCVVRGGLDGICMEPV